MSSEYDRFSALISKFPTIAQYWDLDKKELNIAALEANLGTMSSGEVSLARWFAAVWLHENKYHFDIVNDMENFDEKAMDTFQKWVADPFFP